MRSEKVELRLHLRNLGPAMVSAWRTEFDGVPNVEISEGDIFSTRPGMLKPSDPIDVRADAIVSPANSFGFMDGGIDAVYTHQLGPQVQERLQKLLNENYDGELAVGQAVIVPTGRSEIPWCISAPTMRLPTEVPETVNAYLAFRAALLAVLEHNRREKKRIHSILSPGLATAVGRMPVERCARQMRAAWDRVVVGEQFRPRSLREAAADESRLLYG